MFEEIPTAATLGQEVLPFEMGYLPEFFQKKAAAELNETPENHTEKLNELKNLLKEDKHSKDLIFIDEFLVQFLRVKKHNAEKAFDRIKSLITLRKKNPNMFLDLKFESIVHAMENEIIYLLPWRCQDGCVILIVEMDHWEPDRFSAEEVKRTYVTYFFSSLQDPMTQVNGFKIILNLKSNKIKHLKHCTPNNLHLIYHGALNAFPIRFKEVHLINDSIAFRTAWSIIKHLLSDKMKSRIIFHKDSNTLLKYFPSSVLPKHFGGDLENYGMTDWLKRSMTPEKLADIGGIRNWPSEN